MLHKAVMELLAVWAIILSYPNKSYLLSSSFKYPKGGTSICPLYPSALIFFRKKIWTVYSCRTVGTPRSNFNVTNCTSCVRLVLSVS